MSGALVWVLVALGLGVVVLRRRSLAVALITVQALVLAVSAAEDKAAPAAVLAVRAVALGTLLLLVVSRTREPRPVRAGIAPIARAFFSASINAARRGEILAGNFSGICGLRLSKSNPSCSSISILRGLVLAKKTFIFLSFI